MCSHLALRTAAAKLEPHVRALALSIELAKCCPLLFPLFPARTRFHSRRCLWCSLACHNHYWQHLVCLYLYRFLSLSLYLFSTPSCPVAFLPFFLCVNVWFCALPCNLYLLHRFVCANDQNSLCMLSIFDSVFLPAAGWCDLLLLPLRPLPPAAANANANANVFYVRLGFWPMHDAWFLGPLGHCLLV